MAAGSPNSMKAAALAISSTQAGPIKQMSLISGVTATATSGSFPTANGSVTVANAATPTVAELQEFCIELKAKQDALFAALIASGAMASS